MTTAWRRRCAAAASVLAGASLLAWPALLNGYPIVFSDTGTFLLQAVQPSLVWDKPFVYGPFLRALHGNFSLWGPLAGQALLLSCLLWLTARALCRAAPGRHLAVCAVLAAGSAAPWFASLLMPDILAPSVVLCLFVLAFGGRLHVAEQAAAVLLGVLATASHLSHLPLAAGVLAVVVLLRWRRAWLAGLPLAGAVLLLLAANAAVHGRVALSPYGSVFALARLVADGPAAATIRAECPQSGWRLCDWADRLPGNSDDFLWDAKGPVWSGAGGPAALAPEAADILRRTVVRDPVAVAAALAGNGWRQFLMVGIGDTLGPDWLAESVLGSLRAYFPADEVARFLAGRQMRGELKTFAPVLNPLHLTLLAAGALATVVLAVRRRDPGLAGLAAMVLMALAVNAVVTGGLSGPHDRYQSRIAWLVLLPPLLAYRRALRAA